jgi:hypothetical protein
MASTKEQIAAAARGMCRRKDVTAGTVTFTVRELLPSERAALEARICVCGPDGKPELFPPADNPAGERVWVHFKPGVSEADEWLAATLEPAYAVEELAAADWPLSLKATLYREARAVNGYTLEDAAKNS